ncbi:unnamed protein product, partial [Mesorhabditis spiculigera]
MRSPLARAKQQMNTIPIVADLKPCVDLSPGHPFDWSIYLDAFGTQPAIGDDLFVHHKFAEQTLFELLFRPNLKVFVQREGECNRLATVLRACADEVEVYFDGDRENSEFVRAEHLLEEPLASILMKDGPDSKLVKFTRNDVADFLKPVKDFIHVGGFFEVQAEYDPLLVLLVQVMSNKSGLLVYGDGSKAYACVHIYDERCHAVGWAEKGLQTNLRYQKLVPHSPLEVQKRAIPERFFEHHPVPRHAYREGQIVEVVVPDRTPKFCPGFISKILNGHYFLVNVCMEDIRKDFEMPMHVGHPFLLSANWARNNGLPLTLPEDFKVDFNYPAFQKELELDEPIDEESLVLPKRRPPEPMRRMEVINFGKLIAEPVVIIRAVRHLVWVTLENARPGEGTEIFGVTSYNLYPCNFAQNNGIRIVTPPVFKALPELEEGQIRFHKDVIFTSRIHSPFAPSNMPYLQERYIKGDYYISTVFVNPKCYAGPYLDEKQVSLLNPCYGPGPLHRVIRLLFRDLFDCFHNIADFYKLFEWAETTELKTSYAKKERHRNKHLNESLSRVLHFPRCETARHFSGWIRTVLRVLQACPHLIALEKLGDGCELGCKYVDKQKLLALSNLATPRPEPGQPREPLTRAQAMERKEVKRTSSKKALTKKESPPDVPTKKPRSLRSSDQTKNGVKEELLEEEPPLTTYVYKSDGSSSSSNDRVTPDEVVTTVKQAETQPSTSNDKPKPTTAVPTGLSFPPTNPATWNEDDLSGYFKARENSGFIVEFLTKHNMGGAAFMALTIDNIRGFGYVLGPALKIHDAVTHLVTAQKYFEPNN